MPFKTITIKKDVYRQLIKAKHAKESFSRFFARILHERNPDLKTFYGAWELEKDEVKKVSAAMKKMRSELEESFAQHESSRQ